MNFQDYLQSKGIISVSTYTRSIANIKNVLLRNNTELELMTYSDVMEYISRRKQMKVSINTINHDLMVMRKYIEYLQISGKRKDNPLIGVKVKGAVRYKVSNVLSLNELEEIYTKYDRSDSIGIRNKVILGLLVYQGLKTNEVENIRLSHLDLEKCTVYIHESVKSNPRELQLDSKQLFPLMNYINTHRANLLKVESNMLIVSTGKSTRIMNTLAELLKELPIENFKQIRTSVISNRLTEDNLREQQIYFGFKYISSIEPYLMNKIDDLKGSLDECFPI